MTLHRALAAARKDLRRRLADPLSLAVQAGIPLVLGALIVAMVSGGSGVEMDLLVADREEGPGGHLLAALDDLELGTLRLRVTVVPEEIGRARVADGEASALLVLPEGFAAAVASGQQAAVEVVTNPAQQVLPELAVLGADLVTEALWRLRRVLSAVSDEVSGALAAGDLTGAASILVARARVVTDPMVSFDLAEQESPAASPALAFVPGFLVMALLFLAQAAGDDLWEEREAGSLRRAAVAPRGLRALLAGKLLATGVLAALVAALALGLVAVGIGLDAGLAALASLVGGVAGLIFAALFMWLQTLAPTRQGARVISVLVTFPLLLVGGSFFPLSAMPSGLASVGRWTPNGAVVSSLDAVLLGETPGATCLVALLGLSILALAAYRSVHRRLRARLAE